MSSVHQVERSVVDGVPTFRVDTPGPAFAMLLFRVGRSDEPLAQAGITHLVEHLAFHRLHHLPYEHNGSTEPLFTRFFAEGDPDEVTEFVRTVASSLADPPLERVRREARIIGEEAAERNTEALDVLLRSRHGSGPHARSGYPEYGLWWLDADTVGAWIRERFVRANAALVLSGDLPEDLGLDALPLGQRFVPPPVTPIEQPLPRHIHGPDGIVLGSMLAGCGPAVGLTHAVLEREVEQRLRHDQGLSYQTIAERDLLGPTHSELLIGGVVRDAEPAGRAALAVRDLLAELSESGPDPALLDAARRKVLRQFRDPLAAVGTALWEAEGALIDAEITSLEDDVATLEAATTDTIATIVGAAFETLIMTVPDDVDVDDELFGPCPRSETEGDAPVTGRSFKESRISRRRTTLVVGDEAVGMRFSDDTWWRVDYDQVEAVCWYDDGLRELMTVDGLLFPVDPTSFRQGAVAVAALDTHLPEHLWAPLTGDGAIPDVPLTRRPSA
ncbi:MAG: insulinase family protein [Nitriliruptoraceae bacterium]|nr:insulinase family protein [Nitriliruptoraceae bacterium]